MSDLDDARTRLTDLITRAQYLLLHLDEIHDCGYSGSGKVADGSGRSQRFHYYGDEVGDKRWRSSWRALAEYLGLRRTGDRYTEFVRLSLGVERLINAGPPLTPEEYLAIQELEEKRNNANAK